MLRSQTRKKCSALRCDRRYVCRRRASMRSLMSLPTAPDSCMPRWRPRLVASIALAAFAIANLAWIPHTCVLTVAPAGPGAKAALNAHTLALSCTDCRPRHYATTKQTPIRLEEDREHPACLLSPSCPCDDGGEGDCGCPCSGGCLFCSVAKVPCLLPSAVPVAEPAPVAHSFMKANPLSCPLSMGRLYRPPRA
jgi:hypothetical protein